MIDRHIVYCTLKAVSKLNNTINKDSTSSNLSKLLNTSNEIRIVCNSLVPNSSDYPTIKDYLKREASDNYVITAMSETMIITDYSSSDSYIPLFNSDSSDYTSDSSDYTSDM